jgi:hypothetical protein
MKQAPLAENHREDIEAAEMTERFRSFLVYFFYIVIVGGGVLYHLVLAAH